MCTGDALHGAAWSSDYPRAENRLFGLTRDSATQVLNALAIDPGQSWKGVWRWWDEEVRHERRHERVLSIHLLWLPYSVPAPVRR